MGWIEVEGGWDKVEEEISSTLGLDVREKILTMDGTNSVWWLWGTYSCAKTSLRMVSLVIVLVTQFE